MFYHNFKYTLKTLFRNKTLIFWTFAFPIIMATFFNLAFSNIAKSEKLGVFDIAVVENEEFKENTIYQSVFNELSDDNNKEKLFNVKYVNLDDAKNLLSSDKIVGYFILVDDKPELVFMKNGVNQTILKYVIENIEQNKTIISDLIDGDYENALLVYNKVYEISLNSNNSINDISNNNLDYVMIEFYTLIAMTCLYGGMLGMVTINQKLANMGNIGKRVSIAPTKKIIVIFSSLLASYVTQLIGLVLLFIYTVFVLNVNYGDNICLIILLSLVGSLAGLTLGMCISASLKTSEGAKIGILLSVTMVGCFLSGMMGISMKYIIDKNMPVINKINPANMITDGFYSLYYYDTLNRYWMNIISLLIFSGILIVISILNLRRQKYDSI